MNCEEFETLAYSLVSGRSLEAVTHLKAHAHAEKCPRCKCRLENERTLVKGLRTLAVEIRDKEAPAAVQKVVLEAFRESHNLAGKRITLNVPLDRTKSQKGRNRIYPWVWIIVASAASLVLTGIGLTHWQYLTTQHKVSGTTAGNVSTDSSRSALSSVQPRDLTVSAASQQVQDAEIQRHIHQRSIRKHVLQRSVQKQEHLAPEEPTTKRNEIETGFLPIMAASPLGPTESGHLVRMNLPRFAMGRFGFFVNVEQAEQPVKADVLIGEDGVARAIRFVYTADDVAHVAQ